jgi:hypothetical protein
MQTPVRWFRFFTVPMTLATVLVGRNIINRPHDSGVKIEEIPFCGPIVERQKEKVEGRQAAAVR